MAVHVPCPGCGEKLRVPTKFAGRRMMCPRCDEAFRVPYEERPPAAGEPAHDAVPMTVSDRLGVAALALGVFSVLILCVPFVGYASIGLSGLGFFLSVGGLLCSPRAAGGAGATFGLGGRPISYPLAGLAACLAALALALVPFLMR
jgi:hypothetical protein